VANVMSRRPGTIDVITLDSRLQNVRRQPLQRLKKPKKPRTGESDWFNFKNQANSDATDVYIFDAIGGWFGVTPQEFVDEIKKISTPKINLHLNTPGGAAFDGVAIYNSLRHHPAQVITYVDGLAASAGSFIAQAGDEVYMSLGSMMMIHDALGITIGNAAEHDVTSGLLNKLSNNIAALYADRAGQDSQYWRDYMLAETWFTADEAVSEGLADGKFTGSNSANGEDGEGTDPSNIWDLNFFNYAGRAKAPSPVEIRTKIRKEKNVADENEEGQQGASGRDEPGSANTGTPETPDGTEESHEEESEQADEQSGNQPNPTTPPSNMSTVVPSGQTFTFTIGGKPVTDYKMVQQTLTAQEQALANIRVQNRKDFVAKLATDGKITAAQLGTAEEPGLEDFALGLSDSAYAAWCKTWDVAPKLSLFQPHGSTPGDQNADTSASANDELQTNLDVVRQFKLANLPQDKLEKTPAWQYLKDHDALNQL
jgi:ATP-dependent protease ClpP protease subunit